MRLNQLKFLILVEQFLSYSDKNSESLVLITSRSNFYTNEVDKKTKGTFEGYYEIKFKPIDNAEIEIYLEKMKTDILNFYSFRQRS